MSKVSITQAAKLSKISRSTLYNKYIKTGIISVETTEDKKLIDVSELIRVFGSIQLDNNFIQHNTPENTTNTNQNDKDII
jgi:predicted site-specific integrase-resolvase